MRLENTRRLLCEKQKEKEFGSYAVLVSYGGEKASLYAEAVNADSYFDIASMGKVLVTSTLALKALEEKRLSLADTLPRFFEAVPEEKREITVAELLTHTSGIVRHEIPQEAAEAGRDAVAAFILAGQTAFAPGTAYAYSCNGMILLGYILEKIYGKGLEALFTDKIKKPLGYERSRFNIEKDEPNAVICYRTEGIEGLAHPWDDENIRVLKTSAGSGGQFFTIADLEKFADAVMKKSGVLYGEEIFGLAERNYNDGIGEARGLGWLYVDETYPQTGRLFPKGSFGHCGHTGTSMFFSREKDLYVILLTNATRFQNMKNHFKGYDYGAVMKLREEIHNAIYEDIR